MKVKFTKRIARRGARRGAQHTRKVYRGGNTTPVNTQALLTSLTTAIDGVRQVLHDNGTLQPLFDIFADLRFIIFSPQVGKELFNALASFRTNGTVAAAIIDSLTVMGVRGVNQPGIVQLLQTLQTQYNILSKPAVQQTITSIGDMVVDIVSSGDVPNAIGTIGTTALTNILSDSQINNLVNDVIIKLNTFKTNRTLNNAITQVASAPRISSGPSADTEAAAREAAAAARMAGLTGSSTTRSSLDGGLPVTTTAGSTTTAARGPATMSDEEMEAAREAAAAARMAGLMGSSTTRSSLDGGLPVTTTAGRTTTRPPATSVGPPANSVGPPAGSVGPPAGSLV